MFSKTTSAYRAASAEGATQIGLMVIVYDAIAFEIQNAGSAVLSGDVQARCASSNKALLLLGHLQSWSERLEETALIAGVELFYATVRARLLHLQVAGTQAEFQELSEMVLSVRASWQQKEQQLTSMHVPPTLGGSSSLPNSGRESTPNTARWSA